MLRIIVVSILMEVKPTYSREIVPTLFESLSVEIIEVENTYTEMCVDVNLLIFSLEKWTKSRKREELASIGSQHCNSHTRELHFWREWICATEPSSRKKNEDNFQFSSSPTKEVGVYFEAKVELKSISPHHYNNNSQKKISSSAFDCISDDVRECMCILPRKSAQ